MSQPELNTAKQQELAKEQEPTKITNESPHGEEECLLQNVPATPVKQLETVLIALSNSQHAEVITFYK